MSLMFRNFLTSDFVLRWSEPMTYIEALLLIALIIFVLLFMYKVIQKKIAYIVFLVCVCLTFVTFVLGTLYAFISFTILSSIFTMVFTFINMGEIRNLIKGGKKKKVVTNAVEDIEDDTLKKLETAVKKLAHTKTGAIITIERSINVDDFMTQDAVKIDCPITPEILETIFYPGTRLHDGAVVIRGSVIVDAAVFYQPSTKPLNGKYGARHRAALGIAEVTDSVTIVVSEETGRVTLAYNGGLESVPVEQFFEGLKDALASEPIKIESKEKTEELATEEAIAEESEK